jgi:hypothetical protein
MGQKLFTPGKHSASKNAADGLAQLLKLQQFKVFSNFNQTGSVNITQLRQSTLKTSSKPAMHPKPIVMVSQLPSHQTSIKRKKEVSENRKNSRVSPRQLQ